MGCIYLVSIDTRQHAKGGGVVYVGQSRREGFTERQNEHLAGLRRGVHANEGMQSAFEVYGEDAFWWSLLERDVPTAHLLERERFYIAEVTRTFGAARVLNAASLPRETGASVVDRTAFVARFGGAAAAAPTTTQPLGEKAQYLHLVAFWRSLTPAVQAQTLAILRVYHANGRRITPAIRAVLGIDGGTPFQRAVDRVNAADKLHALAQTNAVR